MAAVALVAGSRDAAEDAVQEALVRAWERPAGSERIESLPAWVTRVSLNLSKSRLRRIRAEARARDRLGAMRDHGPTGSASRTDVERALRRIPRRQREVTVLRYYLGMDVRGIAETLGVSEGTVKTQLFRARRSLAELLGEADDHDEEEEEEVEDRAHR